MSLEKDPQQEDFLQVGEKSYLWDLGFFEIFSEKLRDFGICMEVEKWP